MRKRNHKTRPLNTALHLCFQIQLPSMTKQRYPTTCHQLVKCLIQISIKNLIWLAKREAYREKSTSSSKQHTCIELVTLNVPFQIYDQNVVDLITFGFGRSAHVRMAWITRLSTYQNTTCVPQGSYVIELLDLRIYKFCSICLSFYNWRVLNVFKILIKDKGAFDLSFENCFKKFE